MHNVLRGHVVWKHNYEHGMLFYKTGKQTIIGRATYYYFTDLLFTQNYHHQERGFWLFRWGIGQHNSITIGLHMCPYTLPFIRVLESSIYDEHDHNIFQ
jgi:hypothetical protein